MKLTELKECWSSHSFKSVGWWWWPICFLMSIFDCATCAVGIHSWDNLKEKGLTCVWCGKQWHK